jgi:hypothetical protein
MTKKILFYAVLFFEFGCSHTIDFRAVHFITPTTGENTWDGEFSGIIASATTKVSVINDIQTNPPSRTSVDINEDYDIADLFMLHNIGTDLKVTTFKGLDLVLEDSVLSLKYQFLNSGAKASSWVASIQAGMGSRKSITKKDSDEAESVVKTTSAAISIGYVFEKVIPYLSYLKENHDVSTTVVNTNGNFGPYDDMGTHEAAALGVTSYSKGFTWAIEYDLLNIKWDRGEKTNQEAFGVKLGYAW